MLKSILCTAGIVLATLMASAQFTVKGIVLDAETNAPVSGAQIKVDGQRRGTVTDVEGRFLLTAVTDGSYMYLIGAIGYKEHIEEFEVSGKDVNLEIELVPDAEAMDVDILPYIPLKSAEVEVTRAGKNDPVAFTNLKREEFEKLNNAQDVPYLLRFTPSLVVTSDAGAGVGYTGMRIRGSDQTRINVTLNGIPMNDAESQNVFWVDLPDLGSNTSSFQIQRGVGTSSNGAGAFGGTVKLNTNSSAQERFAEVSNTYGSFNTWKNSVAVGTGNINGWSVEARMSRITSDGYIDRASSNLFSYYTSATWYGGRFMVKALAFGGRERTYQSWYGTPESRLNNDEEAMLAHAANNGLSESQTENLLNSGRTYNFYEYEDQVDDYAQDYMQLHAAWEIRDDLRLNVAGHYTYGRGFFEQFRADDDFEDYGLLPLTIGSETIESADIIRRRWLENDFVGGTWSLVLNRQKLNVVLGGAYNEYYGNHFGELTWMEYSNGTDIGDLYYLNKSTKTDFNSYLRADYELFNRFRVFADLQYRVVNYDANGLDSDRQDILVDDTLPFFNPKVGVNYQLKNNARIYASYSVGGREPVRGDYIDAIEGQEPKPETMQDIELGYQRQSEFLFVGLNLYAMEYKDQLVLTGELNDVGNPIRQNVDRSYRRGVELEVAWKMTDRLMVGANGTYSMNKIQDFTQYVYDYTNGFDIVTTEFAETDIAFSPSTIAAGQAEYKLLDRDHHELSVAWMVKHVGKQYLDNTSNDDRAIDAYLVNDARLTYVIKNCCFKRATVNLLVNNVLNEMYSSNGYTFSYIVGETITENFYYPQAGTNFLLNLKLEF